MLLLPIGLEKNMFSRQVALVTKPFSNMIYMYIYIYIYAYTYA